jgi:hypothetical protein
VLLEQAGLDNHDLMRQRLAHVIDRQRRDRGAGKSFHLDTGPVMDRDRAADHGLVVVLHLDGDVAAVERERVAERDQLVRALGCHHASDDRGVEDRPFLRREACLRQCACHGGGEAHPGFSDGAARGRGLSAHVHHRRPAICIDVCQSGHGPQPPM